MKNLLLFLTMLIATTTVFSQLYVSPNGATDSYVFVNDEILFVEQDVNLVANTNSVDTEASIYLRQQAQLIQGNTASSNSGTGSISVIQNTPDDDSWDYSFWGSPVGNATGTGNQNFGILRLNDSLTLTRSQVTATTTAREGLVTPLTISTRWTYSYAAGGPWTRIYANNVVTPGYGFIMKGVGLTNHNQNYDFRGRPNNGTMSVAVLNGEHTLSGNPYPSALDLNRVFYDPDNTEILQFKYWDEDRTIDSHLYIDNKGGYGTWVPGASDPNGTTAGTYVVAPFLDYDSAGNPTGGQSGGSGAYYERRFAPIGQGFQILGLSNGSINIKNNHRRYIVEGVANNSQYRGQEDDASVIVADPGGTVTPVDNRMPQLRIYTTFGESHFRDMVLAFSDESTDGFDRGFDARHPLDAGGGDVYFPIGDDSDLVPYVIQTVPFAIEKKVPYTITLDQEFKILIEVVEQINFDGAAYLWDKQENTYRKITQGSIAELLLPAGIYENRFYIVFRDRKETYQNSVVATETVKVMETVTFFQNNPYKQMEISNPEGYTIKNAKVFDMAGKLVINQNNLGNGSKLTVGTANLSDGVYLIKLITSENINIDFKMIIKNN
ncbi:MAG: T9SS type A sorting domain-containing protein [Flavobacteriaceae bacterium]|nr:T9SS type A sorting domain-containing protein [Flavobacteriaceae bacterium]